MKKHLSMTTGPQRLAYGAAAGIAVGLLPWPLLDGMARGVLGWTVGVAVYLALVWSLAYLLDARQTRERAQSLDQPNVLLLVVVLTAVMFSVVAIAMLLQRVRDLSGLDRGLHVVLALLALAMSWLMIHTVYAVHYAHHYYINEKSRRRDEEPALDFPGKAAPGYADFIYYAFVIGMTSQVSDVQVRSPDLRRITLVHSVLSFAFNMLVLALSINVVAGIIS